MIWIVKMCVWLCLWDNDYNCNVPLDDPLVPREDHIQGAKGCLAGLGRSGQDSGKAVLLNLDLDLDLARLCNLDLDLDLDAEIQSCSCLGLRKILETYFFIFFPL